MLEMWPSTKYTGPLFELSVFIWKGEFLALFFLESLLLVEDTGTDSQNVVQNLGFELWKCCGKMGLRKLNTTFLHFLPNFSNLIWQKLKKSHVQTHFSANCPEIRQ